MARLILVTGDKGGVGKSFTARTLLDWKLLQEGSLQAFDTDRTNSTLFRYYQEDQQVQHLDFEQASDLDHLLEQMAAAKKEGVFLIDCAARTMDVFLKWASDVDFMELKKELSIHITLAFVLGPEKDCVTILKDVAGRFKDGVDYVIIKNLAKGSDFSIYQNSNTRKVLLEDYGAIEIEMPTLLEKTVLVLDRLNLNFYKALSHPEVQIADKSRIRLFREKMNTIFSQGAHLWM